MRMEIFFVIAIFGIILMSCIAFIIGKKLGDSGDNREKVLSLESRIAEMLTKIEFQDRMITEQTDKIIELTSKCSEYKTNAENTLKQLDIQRQQNDDIRKEEAERNAKTILELKKSYENQINDLKDSYNKQLAQVKENTEKQLAQLRELNKEQVETQLALIKEQMRTTSEDVLKMRQVELENQNKEQVSKIIDPLQKSLKDMEQALNNSKEQQKEALTRLDETIKLNMEKSVSLGETADRLTRALTGEVKIQGNFGELKLKQLLEDL